MHTKKYVRTCVLDCGKNSFTFFDGKGKAGTKSKVRLLNRNEVLELYKHLETGTMLVIEYSHGGCPRKGLSLSQPFEGPELLEWYDNLRQAGITLKLFPQKSTPRAISYAYHVCGFFNDIPFEDVKNDFRDPVMIYKFIEDFPCISMMNPPESFEERAMIIEAWAIKNSMNELLNYARRFRAEEHEEHESGYILPAAEYRVPNDAIVNFILNNLETIYDELDDTARDVFGLHFNKKGELQVSTKKQWKIQMPQLYSVLVTLMDHTDKFVFRTTTEDLAGWAFVKRYLLCMTPFHLRGGVARSNIFHHGMKNWIAKMAKLDGVMLKRLGSTGKMSSFVPRGQFTNEQNRVFIKYRKQYCDSVRKLFQVCKKIMMDSEKYAELRSSLTAV